MRLVRFVYILDPNPKDSVHRSRSSDFLPHWPKYNLGVPANMVVDATQPWVEADTWRREGIDYLKTYDISIEVLA